jgi:hypothetical protein
VGLGGGVDKAPALAQRGAAGRQLLTPTGGEAIMAASDPGTQNLLASLSRPSGDVRSDGSPARMAALVETTLEGVASACCVGARI